MAEVRRAGADTVINVMGYHSNNRPAGGPPRACAPASATTSSCAMRRACPCRATVLVDHLLGAAVHLLNDEESERDMELAPRRGRAAAARRRRAVRDERRAVPEAGRHDRLRRRRPGAGRAAPRCCGQRSGAGGVRGRPQPVRAGAGVAQPGPWLALHRRPGGLCAGAAPTTSSAHAGTIRQRLDLPRTYAPEDFDVVERYAGSGRAGARGPGGGAAGRSHRRADGRSQLHRRGPGRPDRPHRRRRRFGADETVVFVHTGGTPAIFSYAEELVPAETLAVTAAPAS